MSIRKVLDPGQIRLNVQAETKLEVIHALLDICIQTGKVRDRDLALRNVLGRETRMSTGIRNGIGIPHGKTSSVDELVAAACTTAEEVDFESLDGRPCRIFIMTLSPLDVTGPHLQFLAEVSGLLRNREKRQQLLAAKDSEEAFAVLCSL